MIAKPSPASLRLALAGAAMASALLLTVARTDAQAISGHNSNAPVDYSADRIELMDKQQRVVLSGSVDVKQGDMRLRAARVTVAYTSEGSLRIQRMDAAGGVVVTRGDESARGDVAVYDFNRRLITMVGNVTLRRATDTLNGGRLTIDLASGISTVEGRSGASGRVSGSFRAPSGK